MVLPININLSKNVRRVIFASIILCATGGSRIAQAEANWMSFTFDNDVFVGTDNSYTNGMFFSWYDTAANNKPEPGFFARAMLWSLPEGEPQLTVSARTVGQVMSTPEDIDVVDPPPDDLPYAGLLFYSDTFIAVQQNHADKISTTIGILGPASLAEDTQDLVHQITDSEDPKGWDTQLENELVFQFARARTWRTWASDTGNMDILLGSEATLGTIQSSVGASAMFRYGRQLHSSFGTSLLASGKTANPIATDRGWYLFAGTSFRYVFNQIFFDGNTYRDSRSIDYDHEQVSLTAGIAYSWKDLSITFAINDLNVIAEESREEQEELSEYGTLTVAWRH